VDHQLTVGQRDKPGAATNKKGKNVQEKVPGEVITPPVVWLLGKVQSGKSSIIRVLTGLSHIEIGSGFKATTTKSRIFDFPNDVPLIRFLDTRGIGETNYNPTADIESAAEQSELVLVVMKALDHQQSAILDTLQVVRERRPDLPVVIAQTTLHEAYAPGGTHTLPYPFNGAPDEWKSSVIPQDLARSLAKQRMRLKAITGSPQVIFVPLDFTHAQDGYQPLNYGLQELVVALEVAASNSVAISLRAALAAANAALADHVNSEIIQYATAAAAAGLVPVAGAVAVPGIQVAMLRSLALVYGVPWDRQTTAQFAGCLGSGTVVRILSVFGIRELVKVVPIYGQTAGAAAAAASSFATTYAMGRAATYFLGKRRLGDADTSGVETVYADALRQAFKLQHTDGPPRFGLGGKKL
jgi:uncharacterized protein (DUF697 family)/predicted GTPase